MDRHEIKHLHSCRINGNAFVTLWQERSKPKSNIYIPNFIWLWNLYKCFLSVSDLMLGHIMLGRQQRWKTMSIDVRKRDRLPTRVYHLPWSRPIKQNVIICWSFSTYTQMKQYKNKCLTSLTSFSSFFFLFCKYMLILNLMPQTF